jgi:hypothetical protein
MDVEPDCPAKLNQHHFAADRAFSPSSRPPVRAWMRLFLKPGADLQC